MSVQCLKVVLLQNPNHKVASLGDGYTLTPESPAFLYFFYDFTAEPPVFIYINQYLNSTLIIRGVTVHRYVAAS